MRRGLLVRGRDTMRIVFVEGCLIGQAAGNIVGKELLVRGRDTMRIVSIE